MGVQAYRVVEDSLGSLGILSAPSTGLPVLPAADMLDRLGLYTWGLCMVLGWLQGGRPYLLPELTSRVRCRESKERSWLGMLPGWVGSQVAELASWWEEGGETALTGAKERRREACVMSILVRETLLVSLLEAELQVTMPRQV